MLLRTRTAWLQPQIRGDVEAEESTSRLSRRRSFLRTHRRRRTNSVNDAQVNALGSLYQAERSTGQDLQTLDFFMIATILTYIGVATGWTVASQNSGSAIPKYFYPVLPLPVLGLVGYQILLMALAAAHGRSIQILEEQLWKHVPSVSKNTRHLVGSAAEERVTNVSMKGSFKVLSVYSYAIEGLAVILWLLWTYISSWRAAPKTALSMSWTVSWIVFGVVSIVLFFCSSHKIAPLLKRP